MVVHLEAVLQHLLVVQQVGHHLQQDEALRIPLLVEVLQILHLHQEVLVIHDQVEVVLLGLQHQDLHLVEAVEVALVEVVLGAQAVEDARIKTKT